MIRKFAGIAKYIISGGSAAAVNIGVLYLLTEFGHLYYLVSSVLSFISAFFISFTLQKFWTFNERSREDMHWQMIGFLFVSVLNLVCNTILIALFVEWLHLWYLFGAILAGGILAVITFFIYRHIIFISGERSPVRRSVLFLHAHKIVLLASAAFLLCVFFATYKLTESPPTWLDEGVITQVAINIAQHGPKAVLMTEPGTYLSAGYVSTSYPVTYPIAIALRLFGVGIFQARSVMVLFILLCVGVAYALARREMTPQLALASLFLIATFAPLYGNGKNVLGEVPGLFFISLFLYMVRRIEKGSSRTFEYLLCGLFLGLAVVTKPIFLLLLVPAAIVLFSMHANISCEGYVLGILSTCIPIAAWFMVQFGGETVGEMLAIYANPHSSTLSYAVVHNVLTFVKEPEPLYALVLLATWIVSLGVRLRRKLFISKAEWIAASFAVLVYIAYLRTEPFYRYFFPGEFFALLYLPQALATTHLLSPHRFVWLRRNGLPLFLVLLIGFQTYQVLSRSWVAEHYDSHQSQQLAVLRTLPTEKSILLYQVPEAAMFLPQGMQYSQYLEITKTIVIGKENADALTQGLPDIVVMPQERENTVSLKRYTEQMTLGKYAVWYKK